MFASLTIKFFAYGSEYFVYFIKCYYISVFGSDLSSLTAQKTGN